MKITASAPARIDLSGGATDWCGMQTLAMAIDLRAYATIEPHHNENTVCIKVGDEEIEYEKPKYDGQFDLFKAVIELSGQTGFRIEYKSDIPRGSGLGGSAPLTVATLYALKDLFSKNWSKYYIAELAQRAETLKLKTVQGYQDQYTATFGGLVYMDFAGKACQKGAYSKPIEEEPYATVENLSKYLPELFPIVVVPKIDRISSNDTNGLLSSRYLNGEVKVVKAMKKKAELTREARKALIEGDLELLYSLINENNEIMKGWNFLSKHNINIEEIAQKNGALAVKTCGAGRAGMAIFAKNSYNQEDLYKLLKPEVDHIFNVKIAEGVRYER